MSNSWDWTYQGEIVTQELLDPWTAFVYRITLPDGRIYYGKKLTTKAKTLPPLKGKIRKRKSRVPSAWANYWSSSDEIKEHVKMNGKQGFKREILRLCSCKAEASYFEGYYIISSHALLDPAKFLNKWADLRVNRFHLRHLHFNSPSDATDRGEWVSLDGMSSDELRSALFAPDK